MRLRFFKTGDEAWEEVKEKILKSIEEEERSSTNLRIPSAVPPDYLADYLADYLEDTTAKLLVSVSAND